MTLDPRKRNRFLSQKGSVNNSIDEKRSVSRNEQSNNELKKIQIKTT